jgi:CHAT domain-containing protein
MVKGTQFPGLPETGPEAKAVANAFATKYGRKAEHGTGRAVSRDGFVEQVEKARFLHLATHGYFLPADPYGDATSARDQTVRGLTPMSLCGLALSGASLTGKAGHEDFVGVVTAEEIARLDLSGCELAVLSACDTYLGEMRTGHGLASLQNALHAAGARLVITTRWQVPDKAARMLVEQFYLQLWSGPGTTPRAALAAAKKHLRNKGYEAEVNWAAFVLTGDLQDPRQAKPAR